MSQHQSSGRSDVCITIIKVLSAALRHCLTRLPFSQVNIMAPSIAPLHTLTLVLTPKAVIVLVVVAGLVVSILAGTAYYLLVIRCA